MMENELLKEPWLFSHIKTSPKKEEDITAFSAWEENFQDLSDWCMDTFQGQCDFHIGESTTFKLSGTKNEDKNIMIVGQEAGALRGLKSALNDDKCNLKMHNVKMIEKSTDDYHMLLSPPDMMKEYTKEYHNEENNISSSWLMSPESTASTSNNNNNSPNKRCNADTISVPLPSECHNKLDYVPTTISLNSTVNQRETWDELRTIETAGLDTFDLLSYVCDDEIRSPEGSISTDSSAVLQVKELTTPSSVCSPVSVKIKTEEINELPVRRRMETRATSTITSSSIDNPVVLSQRLRRTRNVAINKKKERCTTTTTTMQTRRERSGTKRYYESDSDDDSTISQYRESREKNNEASRKSRMNKKAKESEMSLRAMDLERDNRILKMKVEELEKLVTSMRSALLRSALKKEI